MNVAIDLTFREAMILKTILNSQLTGKPEEFGKDPKHAEEIKEILKKLGQK